ncbi:SRPBCC family protein [Mesorhizobium sp. ZMM04-5]|uniref:SRPBCC family protein n=1 Tax=Mesorhizobium marinum TaxID=3228790 RepID=A0ABV3R235_9HYPH
MNVHVDVDAEFPVERELVLERVLDAPREQVYRAWTEPKLLKQWFAPKPWTTPGAALDVRPGGSCLIVMRDPDGNDHPSRGVYLEVVENEKLVFTDAFSSAWEPAEKPFMTAIVTFEDIGSGAERKTRYVARARHASVEDREAHEQMGFHQGWSQCAEQLAELLAKL